MKSGPGHGCISVSSGSETEFRTEKERTEITHSLQDLVVLDALLQILQVGVCASDRPHVRFKELDVPFLRQTKQTAECVHHSGGQGHDTTVV